MRFGRAYALYVLGVLVASLAGFLSPLWYLGFIPIAIGLVWAAYDFDLVEVTDAEPPPTAQR